MTEADVLRQELEITNKRLEAAIGYLGSIFSLLYSTDILEVIKEDDTCNTACFLALLHLYGEREVLERVFGEEAFRLFAERLGFEGLAKNPRTKNLKPKAYDIRVQVI